MIYLKDKEPSLMNFNEGAIKKLYINDKVAYQRIGKDEPPKLEPLIACRDAHMEFRPELNEASDRSNGPYIIDNPFSYGEYGEILRFEPIGDISQYSIVRVNLMGDPEGQTSLNSPAWSIDGYNFEYQYLELAYGFDIGYSDSYYNVIWGDISRGFYIRGPLHPSEMYEPEYRVDQIAIMLSKY